MNKALTKAVLAVVFTSTAVSANAQAITSTDNLLDFGSISVYETHGFTGVESARTWFEDPNRNTDIGTSFPRPYILPLHAFDCCGIKTTSYVEIIVPEAIPNQNWFIALSPISIGGFSPVMADFYSGDGYVTLEDSIQTAQVSINVPIATDPSLWYSYISGYVTKFNEDPTQVYWYGQLSLGTSLVEIPSIFNSGDLVTMRISDNVGVSPYFNMPFLISVENPDGLAVIQASSIGSQIAPPVPEADTSAMLLTGLGVIGFMVRRRKINQA